MFYSHFVNLAIIIPLFLLGVLVYVKNKKEKVNWILSLFIFASLFWSLANYIADISKSYETALLWSKFAIIGPVFILALMLHFSWLFPRRRKVTGFMEAIIYLPAIIFTILSPFDLNVESITIQEWGVEIQPGILYKSLLVYLAIYFPLAIASFILSYRKAKGVERLQLIYIFNGIALGIAFAGFTNLILVLLGNVRYTSFGPLSTLIFSSFLTVAILRHRLMGIRLIMSRIYTYAIVAIFSYVVSLSVTALTYLIWGDPFDSRALVFDFLVAIIFTVILLPLINKIQQSSDFLFFKGYNPRKIIKDLSLRLNSVIELDDLYKILTGELKKIIGVDDFSILIFKGYKTEGSSTDVSAAYSLNYKKIYNNPYVCAKVFEKREIIVTDEIRKENKELTKEMEKMETGLIAPLISKNKAIGFIRLGNKISNNAYKQEDIDFIEIISTQVAIAIENALLYQEVEDFNQNLQKKVADQTKKLRESNIRLEKLATMRGEFLNIASHQLRTPVTVIRGMASLLLEGSVEERDRRKFLRGIERKARKLAEIIQDILSASEMDSGRLELDLGPVDISKLLSRIVRDKKFQAEKKNVELKLEMPKRLPRAISNEHYLEQVILNLINNSLQYTAKGSITLKASQEKGYVLIKVIDTGIGIPKEEIPRLFDKFARASNATKVFTDGTGLGLFIIKKIMDAHKDAKIYIEETAINKGTIFVVSLPRAR